MADLEQIIADSVNDSINGVEETPEVVEETPSEPVEASESPSESEEVAEAPESTEVPSPARVEAEKATPEEPQDEFAKLAGMPKTGVGGRENRIPYSRVKSMVEKKAAAAESGFAEAVLGRKLNNGEKALDVVKAHVAQIPELTAKVTDYEARLTNVGQFEDVMANDPQKFLTMLATLPAYKPFFDFVDGAYKAQAQPGTQQQAGTQAVADPSGDMPQPDQDLEDGSKVYSLEGLKKLLEWNAAQTESRVTSKYETKLKEIEDRYSPVVTDWNERRRIEATLPTIRKKLEEARTWVLFNESEAEILEALQKDQSLSLEGAYNKVVFPKLISERNSVRKEVLAELKSAPASTSVPSRVASKPSSQSGGARSLEEIIKEQVATLK